MPAMRSIQGLLVVTALLAIVGCDSDASKPAQRARDAQVDASDADGAVDAAVEDAAVAPDTGVVSADAGHDAGVVINNSFDTAAPIEVDPVHVALHDIVRPGQMDFYWFEGEAGEYYALSTDLNAFSPDTVITLFDADQQQLAENDDGSMWGGDVYDSRLVVRLEHGGKHFVRISTHLGLDPVRPPIYYHLAVKHLMPDAAGITVQTTEDPAPVRFAHDDASGYDYATVLGDFAKVHAAAFEVQGKADELLIVHALTTGDHGNGSSAQIGAVRVLGEDGSRVGEINRADQEFLHPPLSDAKYRLDAELDGKAGDHGFFAIDLVMLPDNPREQDEQDNGALEGAEPIDLKAGMFSRRGLLLSRLPEKDVDYFSFESSGPTAVTIGCEGQSGGSGVLGLHAELRDADDQSLAAADETSAANLLIDSIVLMDPGTYYLRLSSKTSASKDAIEPWARCAVITRP